MGRYNKDDPVTFEGCIETSTAKAYLVERTLGGEVWVPKSQILAQEETEPGLYLFTMPKWWADKNGIDG